MSVHLAKPRILLAAVLAAATLAVPQPAGATSTFTFNGSGYGHGIGMSQYGALGLAHQGWGAGRIVRHYYSGVAVERRDPPRHVFRVGLLQYHRTVTLQAVSGSYLIKAGGTTVDTVAAGSTRVVEISGGKFHVRTGAGVAVASLDGDRPLRVKRDRGAVVRVAEWGHSAGRGSLRLVRAGSASGHLVAMLRPEAYLRGIGEMPSSWPQAALRAQVIAARTYAYRTVAAGGRGGCACDILGDPRDQNYVGWDKEAGTGGRAWVRAVRRTAGRIATYGGAPILAMYSSSSGGFTEDNENVWGGTPVPYLRGKCDPGDFVTANGSRTWSVSLSATEVADRARAAFGWNVARVSAVRVESRGVSGRARQVRVEGVTSAGASFSGRVSGWSFKSAMGLRDTRFWVNADRQVVGAIRGLYDKLNCRPGMPRGPKRSLEGGAWQGFDRGRIYRNGQAGLTVWLRGPVLREYRRSGHAPGPLGLPVSRLERIAKRTVKGSFQGGTITCVRRDCTVEIG